MRSQRSQNYECGNRILYEYQAATVTPNMSALGITARGIRLGYGIDSSADFAFFWLQVE